MATITYDPADPELKAGQQNKTGQHSIYLALHPDERAKGFVRPLRNEYVHVGEKVYVPVGSRVSPIESQPYSEHYNRDTGYVAYINYPTSELPSCGKYIKQVELDAINNGQERFGGCGRKTWMGGELADTYARDPSFYGATYCVNCALHLPVNQFVWLGTEEEVGS